MKNKKLLTALYIILMLLPLIAVVVAYPFLPDKIPAHYGMNNQVTRWGNKSETFIFPIITLFFGFFMYIAARGAAEQEKKGSGSEKNNSTITFVAGILSIMVFDILTFYFLYADFHQVENLNDVPFSLTKDFIWRSRNCPHHSRKYHAETKTKFHYRPSNPMEHEKRCRLEKKPAVLRYFIYLVRYHHSDIMFLIRRNFTNCCFSGIVSQCCNCRWHLFLFSSTKGSLIEPPGQ